LLLGTAVAIKLFPGFLILFFVIRKRWNAVIGAILALGAWTGLTLALLGSDTYRTYFLEVIPQLQTFFSWWNNASLNGLCRKLFGPAREKAWLDWVIVPVWDAPVLSRLSSLVLSGAVVGVLVWFTRRARTQHQADNAFGLAITAMLLVSPVTWNHYFLLLLLPLALVWLQLPANSLARLWFLAVVLVLWAPQRLIPMMFITGRENTVVTHVQALTVLSVQCYALVALFVLEIVEPLWRPRARVPREVCERRTLVSVG
jgi:hypothetical protein